MNAHLAHDISHLASGGSGLRVQRITISARVHVGGNWSAGANGGRASLLSMLLSSIWVVSALAPLFLFFGCFSALRLHVSHSVAFMVVSFTCCVNVNTTCATTGATALLLYTARSEYTHLT